MGVGGGKWCEGARGRGRQCRVEHTEKSHVISERKSTSSTTADTTPSTPNQLGLPPFTFRNFQQHCKVLPICIIYKQYHLKCFFFHPLHSVAMNYGVYSYSTQKQSFAPIYLTFFPPPRTTPPTPPPPGHTKHQNPPALINTPER